MTELRVEALEARHGLLVAVRDVTLDVQRGDLLALVGANGAGKTTLLRAIAGAHRPARGRIVFEDRDVTALRAHERARLGIALVPEGRRLFGRMTVEENLRVAGGARRKGDWTLESVVEAFPILESLLRRRGGDLSGGQQQVTAIARALMTNPRLLLIDELSLGLSPAAVATVYQALERVREAATTIVLVEQDLTLAMRVASRIACMLEGRIVLEGPVATLSKEQITQAYFGLRRGATVGA